MFIIDNIHYIDFITFNICTLYFFLNLPCWNWGASYTPVRLIWSQIRLSALKNSLFCTKVHVSNNLFTNSGKEYKSNNIFEIYRHVIPSRVIVYVQVWESCSLSIYIFCEVVSLEFFFSCRQLYSFKYSYLMLTIYTYTVSSNPFYLIIVMFLRTVILFHLIIIIFSK